MEYRILSFIKKIERKTDYYMLRFLWLITLFVFSSCSKTENVIEKKPVKVEAAQVLTTTIPIFIEAIGHVRAFNFAEIKSQVEGRLVDIHYSQGSYVKEGDLLVTIDPRLYQAKVQEAEGMVQETKASLLFAEEKVLRYSKLATDDYVSKLNFDEYLTQREALLAGLKKQEGILKQAKINLDYCFIQAPFSGRVGKKLVDQGNLIENSGVALLTLHQIQPIYVDFSIPEKHLPKVFEKQREDSLKVVVHLSGLLQAEEKGEVVVIDNSVDPKTGMISLRAQFKNSDEILWPGEFTKVRLILEEKKEALVIPESALNFSQKGKYVYTVSQDHVVKTQPVEIGQPLGGFYEVVKGLNRDDLVITSGQFNLVEGSIVDIAKIDKESFSKMNHW